METNTAIIKAAQSITQQFISAIHDEAKGYAVRTQTGWKVIPFDFCNEIAGLGYINRSLLK